MILNQYSTEYDSQHGILEVNRLLEVNELFEWGFLGFLKIYFKNCDFENQLFPIQKYLKDRLILVWKG